MIYDFSDQVVLITGASGNLGKAVARAFLSANARLVLVDHVPRSLQNILPEHTISSSVIHLAPFDITRPESAHSVAAKAVDQFGRIDILVNTVGGYRAGTPLHETEIHVLDYLFNLNARSAYAISQAVIPVMLANGSGKLSSYLVGQDYWVLPIPQHTVHPRLLCCASQRVWQLK